MSEALSIITQNVSHETAQRLGEYVSLLKQWNPKINLISKSTEGTIWTRHIADSIALWPFAPKSAETWVDLGSGGGLPIVPLAIIAREEQPNLHFHAVESDQRKAAFLRQAAISLALPLTVHANRIEDLEPLNADIVSARALSPLSKLLGQCLRHMAQNGCALLPKGATYKAEITDALEHWRFQVQTYPSRTDSNAVILQIKDIQRA